MSLITPFHSLLIIFRFEETFTTSTLSHTQYRMKLTAVLSTLLIGSSAAFSTFGGAKKATPVKKELTIADYPGALAPIGLFDPLGFAAKANAATLLL